MAAHQPNIDFEDMMTILVMTCLYELLRRLTAITADGITITAKMPTRHGLTDVDVRGGYNQWRGYPCLYIDEPKPGWIGTLYIDKEEAPSEPVTIDFFHSDFGSFEAVRAKMTQCLTVIGEHVPSCEVTIQDLTPRFNSNGGTPL